MYTPQHQTTEIHLASGPADDQQPATGVKPSEGAMV